jgi:hypothetical protein
LTRGYQCLFRVSSVPFLFLFSNPLSFSSGSHWFSFLFLFFLFGYILHVRALYMGLSIAHEDTPRPQSRVLLRGFGWSSFTLVVVWLQLLIGIALFILLYILMDVFFVSI